MAGTLFLTSSRVRSQRCLKAACKAVQVALLGVCVCVRVCVRVFKISHTSQIIYFPPMKASHRNRIFQYYLQAKE